MKCRVSGLQYKEIINVSGGNRYGWVGGVKMDLDSGRVRALVVPGRLRLFGLLDRGEDRIFPQEAMRRFGVDTILMETPPLNHLGKGN